MSASKLLKRIGRIIHNRAKYTFTEIKARLIDSRDW